jgi:hypothetical protein
MGMVEAVKIFDWEIEWWWKNPVETNDAKQGFGFPPSFLSDADAGRATGSAPAAEAVGGSIALEGV